MTNKERLNTVLNNVYKEFNFMTKEELNSILNSFIKNSNLLDSDEMIKKVTKNIIKQIYKYLNEKFNNGEFIFYFKKYYNNSLNDVKCFDSYLRKINYTPSFDECTEVLDICSNVLEPLFSENIENIKQCNFKFLKENNFLISLTEVYSVINDFINEEDDDITQNIEIGYIEDSYRAYLYEVGQFPLLTPSQEKELFLALNNGDTNAKKVIANSNLRLVVSIAKKYIGNNIDLLDLIQDGNTGLMVAIEKFDITKGYKFSTYATWWIRQALTRTLANKSRNIRIPVYLHENIMKYNRAVSFLTYLLGREPSEQEIADKLGISLRHLRELKQLKEDCVSLDLKVGEDDDCALGELVASENETPEDLMINSKMRLDVRNFLENCKLTIKEREIIKLRFGFYNNRLFTLEEIGQMFGVTRERIRQVEQNAFRKLRMPSNKADNLAAYLTYPETAMETLIEARKNRGEIEQGLTNQIRSQVTVGKQPKLSVAFERANTIDEEEFVKTLKK